MRGLIYFLLVTIPLTGCGIFTEKPVFRPADNDAIAGLVGIYRLAEAEEPFDKEYLIAHAEDGYLATGLYCKAECDSDCEDCYSQVTTVRLPSHPGTYIVQIVPNHADPDEGPVYYFLNLRHHPLGDSWALCISPEGDYTDEHFETASQYNLEYELGYGATLGGDLNPNNMLSLLDDVWSRVPRNEWECLHLFPEDRSQ